VAYGIVVLTVTAGGISRITAFGDPELVIAFGFPAVPPGATPGRRPAAPLPSRLTRYANLVAVTVTCMLLFGAPR